MHKSGHPTNTTLNLNHSAQHCRALPPKAKLKMTKHDPWQHADYNVSTDLYQASAVLPESPGVCMLQAGSHCDFETITLLFAKGAGLEVCPGRWALSYWAHPCRLSYASLLCLVV